jgi:DNA processing protein
LARIRRVLPVDTIRQAVLTVEDPAYPENLRSVPEAPSLFCAGEILPTDRLAVAIVGTRKATPVGREVAYEIASDLARAGVTIVSGLAEGIDAASHRGALEAGGRTIACLGAGIDVVYPRTNRLLFSEIPKRGALVSEYPWGAKPLPWHFPARNRIIAGLSLGVLVIEAGDKSGALITADWAIKHGKPVMAVPGSVKSRASQGSNRLIQDGAYLASCAKDVLSFLRQETEYIPEAVSEPVLSLTLEESYVLEEVTGDVFSVEQAHSRVPSLTTGRLMSVLSSLEVKGVLKRLPGGKYMLKGAPGKNFGGSEGAV